jgi:hypothetical protein
MHMWVADQAQNSSPAWLASPWVTLAGFFSAVLSLLQALIVTFKWFVAKTDKAATRQRLARCSVVCIVASALVLAPITWQLDAVISSEAQSISLWTGEIFVLAMYGALVVPVIVYWKGTLNYRALVAYSALGVVVMVLGWPTLLYDYYASSVWDRLLVSATPVLTVAVLVATYAAHVIPRGKSRGKSVQQAPATAEGLM